MLFLQMVDVLNDEIVGCSHSDFASFLTKAACCENIEIVLHPTVLRYI